MDFQPGDNVKIKLNVYSDKWDGWKELYDKFWHWNLVVDRIVDLSDVGSEVSIVIRRGFDKAMVKPSYLDNFTGFARRKHYHA